jgi:hypothetical protein
LILDITCVGGRPIYSEKSKMNKGLNSKKKDCKIKCLHHFKGGKMMTGWSGGQPRA